MSSLRRQRKAKKIEEARKWEKRIKARNEAIKKCRESTHLFMELMRMNDIRLLILSFCDKVSLPPVAFLTLFILGRRESDQKERKNLATILKMDWRLEDSKMFTDEMSKTLSLYHWYITVRRPLVSYIYNGDVKCRSNPYVEDVSYECALWYAERNDDRFLKNVDAYNIARWEKDKETAKRLPRWGYDWNYTFSCDPKNYCLALHYGKVKMKDVPQNPINVLMSLWRGKWDIARDFIQRGDADKIKVSDVLSLGPYGIHFILSNRSLGYRFVFEKYETDEKNTIALMKEGVLPMNLFGREYVEMINILKKYGQYLCMKNVEDLYVVACGRASGRNLKLMREKVHEIVVVFSKALTSGLHSQASPLSYCRVGFYHKELKDSIDMMIRGVDIDSVEKEVVSSLRKIASDRGWHLR